MILHTFVRKKRLRMNVIILLCVSMMIGQSQQDTGLYRMGVTLAEQYGDVSVRIQEVELQQEAILRSALETQKRLPYLILYTVGYLSGLILSIDARDRSFFYKNIFFASDMAQQYGIRNEEDRDLEVKRAQSLSKNWTGVMICCLFGLFWHAAVMWGFF